MQTISTSLQSLGINKEKLYFLLAWLIVILIGIFAFIFVGVRAFGLPGAFGAIVNSIFPIGNLNTFCYIKIYNLIIII